MKKIILSIFFILYLATHVKLIAKDLIIEKSTQKNPFSSSTIYKNFTQNDDEDNNEDNDENNNGDDEEDYEE